MIGKLLDWFRGKKSPGVPEELWRETIAALPFLTGLSAEEQADLRRLVEDFLAEKEFTAAGGLELTDKLCVSIAVQGCLPILRLGLSAYRGWVGIVVYPDEFVVPRRLEDESGVVHEYDDVLSGEAWQGGPLIVSWRDAQMAGEGYNVVIHEFAHKLDMLNGEADGLPALHSGLTVEHWEKVLLGAYDDFCRRVDGGEETYIDPYASEHPSEFFAVLSECFFEMPDLVAEEYPELYRLLQRYYRQDPLARWMKAASADDTASG
jgi:Mlc titration factor MtfA (ptsG expression regulator)